jgi:hypothetical protein
MSDFGPSETKTFYIYVGTNDRGVFEHETHAELGSYGRHLVPWWESKTMGWKLWYPTDVDLYGKRRPMLVADHEDTLNISGYTAESVYGNDIMTVEDTFGAGGICLFEDAANPASPSRPRFSPAKGKGQIEDTRYSFDVVANGPLRSIVRARAMGWKRIRVRAALFGLQEQKLFDGQGPVPQVQPSRARRQAGVRHPQARQRIRVFP